MNTLTHNGRTGWILFSISTLGTIILSALYFLNPRTVILKDALMATNSVTNTITNTVTREVIKEVPKEVETIVNVAATIPPEYLFAKDLLTKMEDAKLVGRDRILSGMKDVKIIYLVQDTIKQFVTEDEVKTKYELTLRRNNVPINSESTNVLQVTLSGFIMDDKTPLVIFQFSSSVGDIAWVLRNSNWQLRTVEVWDDGHYFGLVGKGKANEELLKLVEKKAETFANDFLSANPK